MHENFENSVEKQITSIEELKKIAKGQIIELPGFTEDTSFVVRMARPSMLEMISEGSIPNPLIKTASKMFMKGAGGIDENSVTEMRGFTDLLDTLCEKSLVEPSMAQLREIGLKLTDEQKGAILQFVQRGVNRLNSFRGKPSSIKTADGSKPVRKKAE